MRKIRKRILLLIICSICLTGCGSIRRVKINADEITEDTFVFYDNEMFYEYMYSYPDIGALAGDSEEIIYGETTKLRYYMDWFGMCHTKADIKVLRSFKGDLKEGKIMKLVKDQGYVSVKDYIDSLYFREEKKDWRRKYKQYSAEEQKHIYIQQKEKNDIMLEIGQKSIYFLQKSTYYNTDGTYARLNGPEGEYVEIGGDHFMQAAAFTDYWNDTEIQENAHLRGAEDKCFTLDEIASQIYMTE